MWIQAGTMPSANVSVRSLAEEEKYLSGQTVSAPLFCSSARTVHCMPSTVPSTVACDGVAPVPVLTQQLQRLLIATAPPSFG